MVEALQLRVGQQLHGFGAQRLWPLKVRDASAHVNQTRPRLGAVAAHVLKALNWLHVLLWLALLLALLPRCGDFHSAGPSSELVPRWPQLASPQAPRSARGRPRRVRRRRARLAQQRRSCAVKQPRGGGQRSDHTGRGGLVSPLQQLPRVRPRKQRRGPTSSGAPPQAAVGTFRRNGSAPMCWATRHGWLTTRWRIRSSMPRQAVASGSLARPGTALGDDPTNCAREAAEQLKWCAKQALTAVRALRERVRNLGARSVVGSWLAGGGVPETRHTQGVCAPGRRGRRRGRWRAH